MLGLHPHGMPVVFTTGEEIDSAQADLYVNVDGFSGELQLLLHVQDQQTFDFLSIADNVVKLGRMEAGVTSVFEEKLLEHSGWLFLPRCSAATGISAATWNEETPDTRTRRRPLARTGRATRKRHRHHPYRAHPRASSHVTRESARP